MGTYLNYIKFALLITTTASSLLISDANVTISFLQEHGLWIHELTAPSTATTFVSGVYTKRLQRINSVSAIDKTSHTNPPLRSDRLEESNDLSFCDISTTIKLQRSFVT